MVLAEHFQFIFKPRINFNNLKTKNNYNITSKHRKARENIDYVNNLIEKIQSNECCQRISKIISKTDNIDPDFIGQYYNLHVKKIVHLGDFKFQVIGRLSRLPIHSLPKSQCWLSLSELSHRNHPEHLLTSKNLQEMIDRNLDWYYHRNSPIFKIIINDNYQSTLGEVAFKNYHCVEKVVITANNK